MSAQSTSLWAPLVEGIEQEIEQETICHPTRFAELESEWNELLAASDADCLFLRWEWLYLWWIYLAPDAELCIVTLRSNGLLIGLAPLYRRRNRWASETLVFLGIGCVGSDYLDLVIRRGYEERAQDAFSLFFGKQRKMLDLAQIPGASAYAIDLASRLAKRGWHVTFAHTDDCPFVDLSGLSFEDFLGTLGKSHRYNFRRRRRRLNDKFAVSFERAQLHRERVEMLDTLFDLHLRRWGQRGGSDAFHTPALRDFHREFSRRALDNGWLRLYVLKLDQVPVALLYGFLYNRRFYFYQSGFDTDYHKYSVGLVTMGLTIKDAIESHAEEFDFLHGVEPYKFHWARVRRPLAMMHLFAPHLGTVLPKYLLQVRGRIKKIVGKGPHKT